jgi:hypothetical protein
MTQGTSPPYILQQPADVRIKPGHSATIHLVASGDDLTFQWFRDEKPIPNETDATLQLDRPTSDARFSCRVSNLAGAVTSASARLLIAERTP